MTLLGRFASVMKKQIYLIDINLFESTNMNQHSAANAPQSNRNRVQPTGAYNHEEHKRAGHAPPPLGMGGGSVEPQHLSANQENSWSRRNGLHVGGAHEGSTNIHASGRNGGGINMLNMASESGDDNQEF
ncbi:hypothetical protein FGO68_gene5146 [Halteria grandinella]|uniref:Uncharacterized protein n=1 Tax=Halteria grandinella TaxID=5974 RepID=A0A8J8P4K3_HALGN|nr:hypothetical protein FGO68_gene5146 [Halteria grandinella]